MLGRIKRKAICQLWRLLALYRAVFALVKILAAAHRYKTQLHIVALVEHMGDIVACLPVAAEMKRRQPDAQLIWVVHRSYAELLSGNPHLHSVIPQICLGQWIALEKILRRVGISIVDLHVHKKPCAKTKWTLKKPEQLRVVDTENYYNFGCILQAFSLAAGTPMPADLQPDLSYCLDSAKYKNAGSVQRPYVVLHARSNETERNWTAENFLALAEHLIRNDFDVVEIGLLPVINLQSPHFRSMCGRASLGAYATLIANAALFVGVDSGFAHVANALQVRGVIVLGAYRNFPNYFPYSGFYAEPLNCALVRAHLRPASAVPVGVVIAATERFLHPRDSSESKEAQTT